MKNELNVEMICKLYEFGGLYVYTVKQFYRPTCSIIILQVTFNSNKAFDEVKRLKSNGIDAWVESTFVKFDGAFAKNVTN